jgi:HK97 family phage major capsid protein
MRLSDLQESRHSKVAELRNLVTTAETEKRDLSDQERGRFDSLKTEIGGLDDRIGRAQTVADLERLAAASPITGERSGHPDLRNYSLARAIRSAASGKGADGLEGEISAELSRGRSTRSMQPQITIPSSVLLGEARTGQVVGDDTKGGFLVPTTIRPVADRFRPSLKVESLGATILRDVKGEIELPNIAASGSAFWIGENQNSTRSDVELEKVTLRPKTVSGEYRMSRSIMNNSNESMEALLRRDLGQIIATAVDAAALKNRSGGINEPNGLLDSAIDLVTISGKTFLAITADLISALEVDDVDGSRAFLTHPLVGNIARKLLNGNGDPIPSNVAFHDQRVEYSTQVPTTLPNYSASGSDHAALFYGAWSELYIALYSGVDVVLNPYHSDVASNGGALLHCFQDIDIGVRHPAAFAYAKLDTVP